MSDLLYKVINEAPDGVNVKVIGTNDRGESIVQWWACDRYGISLRLREGYQWAAAIEIFKDGSSAGWNSRGQERDLEGIDWIRRFLGEVIAEYRSTVQV